MRPQRVGRYRQKLQLYDVPETTQDTYGQPSTNGTLIPGPGINGTFSAEVIQLKGDEMLNVRQIFPTATHKISLRWLGSAIPVNTTNNPFGLIVPRMYFIDTLDGARLDVVGRNNVEKRNRKWEIVAEEKPNT